MNMIEMIPMEQLQHHPENPRLDLGDLTELADSIKKNGIMQNLTVVPSETEKDRYLVVILQLVQCQGNSRGAVQVAEGL